MTQTEEPAANDRIHHQAKAANRCRLAAGDGPEIEAVMQHAAMGFACEAWFHPESGMQTFSAVEVAHDPGALELGPEYHRSISKHGSGSRPKRASSAEARWCLAQFELLDAKEDNHVPSGNVRNFWRPGGRPSVGL
ncbi:hypothetical protein ACU4GD_32925 [Cupriavidus basilensis]